MSPDLLKAHQHGKGEVSYEINNIEVLQGTAESVIQPNDKPPMIDSDILLNGVCDVNGAPINLSEHKPRSKKGTHE